METHAHRGGMNPDMLVMRVYNLFTASHNQSSLHIYYSIHTWETTPVLCVLCAAVRVRLMNCVRDV